MSIENGVDTLTSQISGLNITKDVETNEWSYAVHKFARCSRNNSPFRWKKYVGFTVR